MLFIFLSSYNRVSNCLEITGNLAMIGKQGNYNVFLEKLQYFKDFSYKTLNEIIHVLTSLVVTVSKHLQLLRKCLFRIDFNGNNVYFQTSFVREF